MIKWDGTPTKEFNELVTGAFQFALDVTKDGVEIIKAWYTEDIIEMFGGAESLKEHIIYLKDIHEDEELEYMVGEYSWLVFDILVESQGNWLNDTRQKEIDIDLLIDNFFYDSDCLLTADEYNSLSKEKKDYMGFSKTLHGVVNRLKPHPNELKAWVDKN